MSKKTETPEKVTETKEIETPKSLVAEIVEQFPAKDGDEKFFVPEYCVELTQRQLKELDKRKSAN